MKQDVGDILKRQYQIATFNWTNTTGDATNLGTLKLPKDLLAVPNIAAKLMNNKYLKANVELEFRINATPFHIGKLLISWLPHTEVGAELASRSALSFWQRTQNNAHELSNDNQVLVLKIPRHAPQSGFTTDDPFDWDIGTVWIDVLNQLNIAGSTTTPTPVTVSVWAKLTEPEPMGYGYVPVPPEPMRKMVKDSVRILQSDKIAKEGAEKSKSGVISSVMEAAAQFAPIIRATPFAEFSPILDGIGALAPFVKKAGFSKPTSVQATQPVSFDDFRDQNFGHGLALTNKFSLHPDAKIGATKLGDCRSYSIKEIIQKPAIIHVQYIPYNAAPDTSLISFRPNPSLCKATAGATGTTDYHPTRMGHLAQMFKNWRGGLKLRFNFVTSPMIAARFRVSVYPTTNVPSSIEANSGDNFSETIDVRGNCDLLVPIPYIGRKPYKQVVGYNSIGDTSHNIPDTEDDCWVVLSLVNQISNPTPDGIGGVNVNISIAAAEDFTFQTFLGVQHLLTTAQILALEQRGIDLQTYLRARGRVLQRTPKKKQSCDRIFEKPFPSRSGVKASIEAGLITSEHYHSIEELTRRYTYVDQDVTDGFIPNNLTMTDQNGTKRSDNTDVMSYCGDMFAYYRGGIRYRYMLPKDPLTSGIPQPQRYYATIYTGDNPGHDAPRYDGIFAPWTDLLAIADSRKQSTLDFEVPWMSQLPFRPTYEYTDYEDMGSQETIGLVNWDANVGVSVGDLFRAGSDDFVFGFPVAPPILNVADATMEPQSKLVLDKLKEKASISEQGDATSSPSLPATTAAPGLTASTTAAFGKLFGKK